LLDVENKLAESPEDETLANQALTLRAELTSRLTPLQSIYPSSIAHPQAISSPLPAPPSIAKSTSMLPPRFTPFITNARSFMRELEAYFVSQSIAQGNYLPTLLQTCTHDEQASDLVLEAIHDNQSWQATKEVFIATFANPILQDFSTLTECKQGQFEPITQFVNRFRQLINNLSAESSNDDIGSTFIANLTTYYQTHLRNTLRNTDAMCELIGQQRPIVDWRHLMTMAMKIAPPQYRVPKPDRYFKHTNRFPPFFPKDKSNFRSAAPAVAPAISTSSASTPTMPSAPTPALVLATAPLPAALPTLPLCTVCQHGRHPVNTCWFNPSSPNYKGEPWRGTKRKTKMIMREQYQPANTFSIFLEGIETTALLDSGSNTSLIDEKYANTHNLPSTSINESVTLADGSIMPISATTNIKVTYAGKSRAHTFLLASLKDCACIVGADLYPQLGVAILFPSTLPSSAYVPPQLIDKTPTPQQARQSDTTTSLPEPVRLHEPLNEALRANQSIPTTAFCTLPYAQVDILLKPHTPIFKRQYPIPKSLEPVLRRQVDEWLADDRITLASPNTEYNLPLTVAPKKDSHGKVIDHRVCLDPRALNTLLLADNFPIPRINDIKARLLGNTIFSELDLRSAFLQLPVNPAHRHMLSFSVALNGKTTQYTFKGAPFGLKHLSSCFQRVMSTLLNHLDYVVVYIDNIIIASPTLEAHLLHLTEVIKLLNSASLRLNVAKCKFCKKETAILGFLVAPTGITVDPAKVAAINNIALPRTVKDLQSFLGMVNFLRSHIPMASAVTSILDKNRDEKTLFATLASQELTAHYQMAFDKVKAQVANSITITEPDFSKPFKLACDASSTTIASMLYQDHGIIALSSRSLSPYERRYPIFKKELLAIVDALRAHYTYLWGLNTPFFLYSDHAALQYLNKMKLHPTLASWQSFISEFNFIIAHIPGHTNVVPDALSRLPTILSSHGLHTYSIQQSLLPTPEQYQQIQDSHLLGHFGTQSVLHDLRSRRKLDWPGITSHVSRVLSECLICQKFNDGHPTYDPLSSTSASQPWQRLFIDTATDFPLDHDYKHLLVVVDSFTRFVVLRPLKDRTQSSVLQALQSIFSEFGIPSEVQTDLGTEYTNQMLEQYFASFSITPRQNSPYAHHQTGTVERVIRTLTNLFKKLLLGNSNWVALLPFVSLFYNNKLHSQTGYTPFHLMFNRPTLQAQPTALLTPQQWADSFNLFTSQHFTKADASSTLQGQSSLARFHRRHNISRKPLQIGTYCMVLDPHRANKFEPSYIGPYQVMELMSNHHYLLRNDTGFLNRLVPRSHIKVVPPPSNPSYQVDHIVDHKSQHGTTYYLIKWRGYARPTWEPAENIDDPTLITRYLELSAPH